MKNLQTVIDSHPAFTMKCLCHKHPHKWEVTYSDGQKRIEEMCTVCSLQAEAMGVKTKLVG